MSACVGLPSPSIIAAAAASVRSLAACEVSFSTGRKQLLDRVSMRINPGKFLAVVGPNGAGKTTLLRLLCGEFAPNRGVIQLDGNPFTRWSCTERARRIAILPQQSTLNAGLTVLETALLGRSPHLAQGGAEANLRIVYEALSAVNAIHLAGRLYPSLSGGEKSRVQTARVLAQIWEQPQGEVSRFLLLDEPTAALDCAHQHLLLANARQFTLRNVGVLAVLHDLNLAAQYADQVMMMSGGQTIMTGSPEDVFQPEMLSEVFGMEFMVVPHPRHGWPLVIPANRSI